MNYYIDVIKKYAVFSGRASRKQYWMFVLVSFIITIILGIIDAALRSPILVIIYDLALLIPGLAVGVRRLHDTGRSGWWLLLGLIPLVGAIILLVFMVLDSQPGDNAYGTNPKSVHQQAAQAAQIPQAPQISQAPQTPPVQQTPQTPQTPSAPQA